MAKEAPLDVKKAKEFLNSTKGDDPSLYEHIASALLKMVTEKPSDSFTTFEHLADGHKGAEPLPPPVAREANPAQLQWAEKVRELNPADSADEPPSEVECQDLPDDMNLLEAAGCSFNKTETFRLHISLKKLMEETTAQGGRIWGKINGVNADYYIAEATVDDAAAYEGFKPNEAEGDGAESATSHTNRFTYWACNFAGGAWTKLPPVTSAQLLCARQLKKFFKGDLDAPVTGYPPFPGTERHLLRATIARISHATAIAPRGLYEVTDDETKAIGKTEEPTLEGAAKLVDAANWVFLNLNIDGVTGRSTPAVEEEEPEEGAPAPLAYKNALVGIADGEGAASSWKISASTERCMASLAIVQSIAWPGAYTVGCGGARTASIYVGYGLKFSAQTYTLPQPPALAPEFAAEGWGEDQEDVVVEPVVEDEGEDD
jgi:radial spoke head protein 4A